MDNRVFFVALLALSGSVLGRRPLQAVLPDGAAGDLTPAIAPEAATVDQPAVAESPMEAAALAAPTDPVLPLESVTPAAAPTVEVEAPVIAEGAAPTGAVEAPTLAVEAGAEVPVAAPVVAAEAPLATAAAPTTAAEAPLEGTAAVMEAATPTVAVAAPMVEVEAPASAPIEAAEAPMTEAAEAPTTEAAEAPTTEAAEAPMAIEAAADAPTGAAISTGDVPATSAGAPAAGPTLAAAPAPGPSGPPSANLLFTMSAKRATVTKQGVLLEGVSPVVTFVSDVPQRHAGRFNTSFFTSENFNFNETWLNNPDAVLMGVVTSGGTAETNGTVGTVVLKLSNPVYNASRYTVLFNAEVQTPEQNDITLRDGNANYWIDEASDKLLDITDRTVLMDNAIFIDGYAQVERAAKGGAKSSVLGNGWCNPLGSLTSFGCESININGVYYGGMTLGR